MFFYLRQTDAKQIFDVFSILAHCWCQYKICVKKSSCLLIWTLTHQGTRQIARIERTPIGTGKRYHWKIEKGNQELLWQELTHGTICHPCTIHEIMYHSISFLHVCAKSCQLWWRDSCRCVDSIAAAEVKLHQNQRK